MKYKNEWKMKIIQVKTHKLWLIMADYSSVLPLSIADSGDLCVRCVACLPDGMWLSVDLWSADADHVWLQSVAVVCMFAQPTLCIPTTAAYDEWCMLTDDCGGSQSGLNSYLSVARAL